jgi:hypothetical protein
MQMEFGEYENTCSQMGGIDARDKPIRHRNINCRRLVKEPIRVLD